jgi:hypothetical protein
MYDICTLVWVLALAFKSEDNGERIIDKMNGIRVFFNCVSYVYMVWGFFGVYEAERPVACRMYEDIN